MQNKFTHSLAPVTRRLWPTSAPTSNRAGRRLALGAFAVALCGSLLVSGCVSRPQGTPPPTVQIIQAVAPIAVQAGVRTAVYIRLKQHPDSAIGVAAAAEVICAAASRTNVNATVILEEIRQRAPLVDPVALLAIEDGVNITSEVLLALQPTNSLPASAYWQATCSGLRQAVSLSRPP